MVELRGVKLPSDELVVLVRLPVSSGKRARQVYVTANCIDDGVDHLLAQLKEVKLKCSSLDNLPFALGLPFWKGTATRLSAAYNRTAVR